MPARYLRRCERGIRTSGPAAAADVPDGQSRERLGRLGFGLAALHRAKRVAMFSQFVGLGAFRFLPPLESILAHALLALPPLDDSHVREMALLGHVPSLLGRVPSSYAIAA
jgi:hypothetical protein